MYTDPATKYIITHHHQLSYLQARDGGYCEVKGASEVFSHFVGGLEERHSPDYSTGVLQGVVHWGRDRGMKDERREKRGVCEWGKGWKV